MTHKHILVTCLILVVGLAGCTGSSAELREERAPIDFVVDLAEDGPQLAITFGLRRVGVLSQETLDAYWQLTDAAGELRAESISPAVDANAIPDDGSTLEIMTWRGELDPGRYELIWGVNGLGSRTVQFEVLSNDGGLFLGEVSNP